MPTIGIAMEFQPVSPPQSRFWFSNKAKVRESVKFVDKTTIVSALALLVSVLFFWPVISAVSFDRVTLSPFWLSVFEFMRIEPVFGMRMLFMSSLSISTIGIYLLVRFMTKRQITAVLAAVAYLVPLTAICLIYFKNDFNVGISNLKSFLTIIYGDGARFAAVSLIPFAALFFLRYLKGGKLSDFFVTVFLNGLIFLSVGPFSFSLMTILTICFLTEVFLGSARKKLVKFVQVLLLSFGIVSYWYTPDFWVTGFGFIGGQIASNLRYLFPLPFIVGILAFFLFYVIFSRREDRQPIFIGFLAFVVFSVIAWGWAWSGRSLITYPHKILPDLVMFGALVFALFLTSVFDKIAPGKSLLLGKWHGAVKIEGLFIFGIISFVLFSGIAYFVSPIAVWAVSGPGGIWHKISDQAITDRQMLVSAGGFKLVTDSSSTGKLVGTTISAACLAYLILLYFNKKYRKTVD